MQRCYHRFNRYTPSKRPKLLAPPIHAAPTQMPCLPAFPVFPPLSPPSPSPTGFIDLAVVKLPFSLLCTLFNPAVKHDLLTNTLSPVECSAVVGPDRPAQQTSNCFLTLITAASPEINSITLAEC